MFGSPHWPRSLTNSAEPNCGQEPPGPSAATPAPRSCAFTSWGISTPDRRSRRAGLFGHWRAPRACTADHHYEPCVRGTDQVFQIIGFPWRPLTGLLTKRTSSTPASSPGRLRHGASVKGASEDDPGLAGAPAAIAEQTSRHALRPRRRQLRRSFPLALSQRRHRQQPMRSRTTSGHHAAATESRRSQEYLP